MTPTSKPTKEARPIRIIEVGPRDGLQNEPCSLSLKTRVEFINALSASGVSEIEAGAFVSPNAVPQMSRSDEVFRQLTRMEGVTYSALVPNERGLDRALEAGVQKIAVFTAASNTFNLHNIHATITQSIALLRPVVSRAREAGLQVRGYISTVVFCPYEGQIHPANVMGVMRQLLDIGVEEIALGETLGKASPRDFRPLLDKVCSYLSPQRVALHLHDTYGLAVANALNAWEQYGITAFDGSAGGLGGCPYAPGASGNVATEDLAFAFKASGALVSVDERKVVTAAQKIAEELGRTISSKLFQVLALRNDLAPQLTG